MRKTKIVCTMGPACDSIDTLKEMIKAGMNVARLNMAHGELEDHTARINNVRKAAAELGAYVPVMMDIKGPEIRIGKFKEASVTLVAGEQLILTTVDQLGDASKIWVNYSELPLVLKQGDTVLIDDGLIDLRVVKTTAEEVYCTIVNGGVLKPRKGVNLPGIRTTLPGVTQRDVDHLHFGIANGIDMVAVSFVRRAEDILEVRRILEENGAGHVQINSKIENEEGVENLDAIIEASDSIMVARGDLGVEIPIENVPMVQLEMIRKCNAAGKPVIVATHMLESMQVNPRPTRAEVSDVSNAVLNGADVVMLSGESAAGKYPVESVRTMAAVAERAESTMNYNEQFAARRESQNTNVTEVISQAVVSTSLDLDAKAILTPTESGFTARMVAKYRPKAPIIAISQHDNVLLKLALVWGVIPVKGYAVGSTDEMFSSAVEHSNKAGFINEGDFVVISAGVPIGQSGTTNLIKVQQV